MHLLFFFWTVKSKLDIETCLIIETSQTYLKDEASVHWCCCKNLSLSCFWSTHKKRGCSSWRKDACVTQNISVTLPKLGRSTRSMHMMGNTPQSETSVGALRTPCFQGPGWSMAQMGQEPLNEGRKGMVIRHAAFPWWVFFPHLWEGKRYHPLCHQTSNSTFRSSLSAADLTYYSLEKIAAFRRGDFISAPAHLWASLRTMLAPAQTKGLAPPFAPVLFHCVIISPVFCLDVHCTNVYKCTLCEDALLWLAK